jgi:hypothetical protein
MPFDADATLAPGLLTHATLQRLRTYFDRQSHYPSPDHWEALEQVVSTMEAMANGTAPAKVFLPSLDCGVGKTTATINFAQSLVQSPGHRDVGMLICVGRLTEATAIAETLNISANRLAVLTSDDKRNSITDTPPTNAQVLVTTQQRLERATEGRSFAGASAFYYQGKPRDVRCWDEAWLPGVAVTLTKDELLWLPKMVRPFSSEFADALPHFALEVGAKKDGDVVEVPDFEALYDVSLYEVLASAAGASGIFRDDQQIIATALLTLNGKTARVRRDGKTGNAILTYRDTFPADLAPLLVLDASGRVRQTYANIEQHRDTLVRLQPAIKDYSPLTIYTWKTSGAKSGWERQGDILAKGIADTVLTKPTEVWLVVVHKAGGRVKDVEAAIRRHLKGQLGDHLRVITWGNHMATNLTFGRH